MSEIKQFDAVIISGSSDQYSLLPFNSVDGYAYFELQEKFKRIKSATISLVLDNSIGTFEDRSELYIQNNSIPYDTASQSFQNGHIVISFDITDVLQKATDDNFFSFTIKNIYHDPNDPSFYPVIIKSLCKIIVEYEQPFDYLNKQQLDSHRLGSAFSYAVDKLTFNLYISKPLFDNALSIDYSLIYNYYQPNNHFLFFPKGFKLNILERLYFLTNSNDIILEDGKYNLHPFIYHDNNIYHDQLGTGLLIEKISNNNEITYKLFDPISSGYKLFNSEGYLTKIVLENGDEINITISDNSIIITDQFNVSVTIDKTSLSLITISTNINNQIYNLNISSDNLLSSLSYYPISSNTNTISDAFFYHSSSNRLNQIKTYDNHQLELVDDIDSLTLLQSHNNDDIYLRAKYEYHYSNVKITNLDNQYTEKYFYDDERNVLMSGQDNNLVNDEDSLNYVEQLFGYSTYLGQENKTHLLFSGDSSVLDLQTDNQGIHQNAFTQPINLTSGKYILFAKVNPITKRQSSINHSNKSLYILCEDLFGQNKMLCFNSFNEQYCATIFIASSDVNNLTFSFKTNQISSRFIISNVYLLKVDYKVVEPIYKIGGFSGFTTSSSPIDINALNNLTFVNNEVHHLHQLDANLNQLIRYKYGYCKFFFTDSLKNVFFFSNSNTPEVFYDLNNSHTPFNNINIGVRKHLNSVNCIYSLISDNSNSNSFYISYLKTALTLENGIVHFECFTSSATYNYHNKLLCKTDFKGITTSNIYNNHLDLLETATSNGDGKIIKTSYTYDSYCRLSSEEDYLSGNETSITNYQYLENINNGVLSFVKSITDGNNHSIYFTYSSRLEYIKTKHCAPDILTSSYINKQIDDKHRINNIKSQYGDYQFFYEGDRERLSKVRFHFNRFDILTPIIPINNASDANAAIITPEIQTDFYTNLISISYNQYQEGDYTKIITYPNNYSYRKEYDIYHRLDSIYFSNALVYKVYYDRESPDGKIIRITDSSSYNDIELNFSYSRNQISYASYAMDNEKLEVNYDYDELSLLVEKQEVLKQGTSTYSYLNKIRYRYSYDIVDNSFSSLIIDIYKTSYSLSDYYKRITINLDVDDLSRLSFRQISIYNNSIGYHNIQYHQLSNQTSFFISSLQYYFNDEIQYFSYDKVGNITSITSSLNSNENVLYEYDYLSRLVKESYPNKGYYLSYTYLLNGTISSIKKKNILNDNLISEETFSYDDHMPYKISKYNNVTITYDNFLNPLTLNGATLTYYRGNKLKTFTKNNTTTTYHYSCSGLRSHKISSSYVSRYFYNEKNKLIKELRYIDHAWHLLSYLYFNDEIIGFTYDDDIYLYEKDLLNNVTKLYYLENNNSLSLVAKYTYDAYGNHRVLDSQDVDYTDTPSFIGNINPIRYRSYYFDNESGFYYCKARYYVPYLRRWLTMDSISYLNDDEVEGSNLFSYCHNNPIMYVDEDGHMAFLIGLLIVAISHHMLDPSTNLFGAQRRVSGGLAPNEFTTKWFRIGLSHYDTETDGRLGIFNLIYGCKHDYMNIFNTDYFAGINISLFNAFSIEFLFHPTGFSFSFSAGQFSLENSINAAGATETMVGLTLDGKNGFLSTNVFTIGINTYLLALVVVLIYGYLTGQPVDFSEPVFS